MAEPQIQYAKTSDGVNIACWTLGEGEPQVQMSAVFISQRAWQSPEGRRWLEWTAEKRRLVRYDSRGFGQSERRATDYSLEVHLLDLEAVVDHLALERFTVFAGVWSGPVAIAYAVRHPERVSHLILWRTSARALDIVQADRARALLGLADIDWNLYTETVAHDSLGWSAGEAARQFAAGLRENATPESLRGAMSAALEVDVSGLLSQVKAPTLVLSRRAWPAPARDAARVLASGIPGARLVTLEGEALIPYEGDMESVAGAIEEFLGDAAPADAASDARSPGAIHAILFTDIVSHTEMMQRLGDAKGRVVLREHERITREALSAHGGAEVKTDGDSFMASFASVSGAVECAVALQRAFAQHSETTGEPIVVRIGLNVGEPIEEDGDYFGSAVILGARIKDLAAGGEILVPEAVRHLLSGKPFLFSDRGPVALKGFEDPVRLYEVRWRAEASP